MCGIAGFAGRRPRDLATLKAMTDAIAHRGPDGDGHWLSDDATVGLGHRRLSIIDLSNHGAQPMQSASGRFIISYNGEIYNYRDLRDELLAAGYPFNGQSDTEVIVAGFDFWGIDRTLRRLAGMFAMAIWDRAKRALLLVRDRVGIKPLYYTVAAGNIAFGSELRPLVAWRGSLPEISLPALTEFFRLGYVPGPLSIFEGVHKLPPGSSLEFHDGEVTGPVAYWHVDDVVRRGLDNQRSDENEILDELDSRLRLVTSQHMISDVPIGAFLSGGVDSSAVTALMQSQSSTPVRTFSIGFDDPAYNEAPHAAEVARHLGTAHEEFYVSESDARDVIPSLPDIYDEPFADISQIPTYLVSKLARQQVTVSLSGDGGDELFGGYNRYSFVSNYWSRLSRVPMPLRKTAAMALAALSPASWDFAFNSAASILPRRLRVALPGQKMHKIASVLSAASLYELQSRLVSQWANPEALVLGAPGGDAPQASVISNISSAAQQMAWDMQAYLVDDILAKVDRATMSVGLEARVPLLDHRIVELAWEIPTSMNFRNGSGKWMLKRLLERYIPRELIDRPKMGFGVPVDAWLRGALKGWADDLLANVDATYLDRATLRDTWQQHLGGRVDRGGPLWCVLMFESWLARTKSWV